MTKPSHKSRDNSRKSDKYWVPVVGKTIDLLDSFESSNEAKSLEQIIRKTAIPHTTAFRILHTLVLKDYLSQDGRLYRLNRFRKKTSFGFANLSKHVHLAIEIQTSLEKAAAAAGVSLQVWDNDRDADAAVRNAEEMVRQQVDLAIEFQLYERVAPVVSDIFARAGIPLISLVNPHHNTVYFGVNNYRAGLSAGKALAEYAISHWERKIDAIVLLESPLAGRTAESRTVGVMRGLEERLGAGKFPKSAIHHVDGGGERAKSRDAVRNFLKPARRSKKILIVGINDESAIGAVEVIDALRNDHKIAVVGFGGSPEIRSLIADPKSSCVGTVSFNAERYGEELLNFALPIVQGRSAPTGRYVAHTYIGK